MMSINFTHQAEPFLRTGLQCCGRTHRGGCPLSVLRSADLPNVRGGSDEPFLHFRHQQRVAAAVSID